MSALFLLRPITYLGRIVAMVLATLVATPIAVSQWVQLGPPGSFSSLQRVGRTIFAGSLGAGVYISTDSGASWQNRSAGGLGSLSITGLAALDQFVFASTLGGGVCRTSDSGQSWETVINYLISKDVASVVTIDTVLFAGPLNYGPFFSTNGGGDWQPSGRGLYNATVTAFFREDGFLFAGTASRGVYSSSDQGLTWTAANNGIPDQETVSSFAAVEGNLYAGILYKGIYRSTDHGLTWTAMNGGLTNKGVTCLVTSVRSEDGGPRLLAGTASGGLFGSTDRGLTWLPIEMGLVSNSVTSLLVDGSSVYAGVGEGVKRSPDGGVHWNDVGTGLSASTVTDLALVEGQLFVGTSHTGIYLSTDHGAKLQQANAGLSNNEISCLAHAGTRVFAGTTGGSLFARELLDSSWTLTALSVGGPSLAGQGLQAMLASRNLLLCAVGGRGVYYSTDGGTNWIAAQGSVVKSSGTIIECFTEETGYTYAGSQDAGVLVSYNSGRSWSQSNGGLEDLSVRALAASAPYLYAGTGSGVFRSSDHGGNWQRCSSGLGTNAVMSFTSSRNVLVAGTTRGGIFVSTNLGDSWTPVNQGLPAGNVNALVTDDIDVYAGTGAGGVCRRSLAEMLLLLSVSPAQKSSAAGCRLEQNYPNPFNPSTTIHYSVPHRSNVTLEVFNTLGQRVAELINGEVEAGYHEVGFNAGNLASGVYFYRLQAGSYTATAKMLLTK